AARANRPFGSPGPRLDGANCRPLGGGNPRNRRSHSKAKVDDVSVLHHVVLALEAELPGFAALRLARVLDEVVVRHHLGADESTLDVAMDAAGRLARRRSATDRPRAALVLACGKEADQIQQAVAGADEPVARALGQAEIGEERG